MFTSAPAVEERSFISPQSADRIGDSALTGEGTLVEDAEAHDAVRADGGNDLLEVVDALLFLFLLDLRVGRVAAERERQERLARACPPLRGRLGEDRAELRRRALVDLRVVVGKRDGTESLSEIKFIQQE